MTVAYWLSNGCNGQDGAILKWRYAGIAPLDIIVVKHFLVVIRVPFLYERRASVALERTVEAVRTRDAPLAVAKRIHGLGIRVDGAWKCRATIRKAPDRVPKDGLHCASAVVSDPGRLAVRE